MLTETYPAGWLPMHGPGRMVHPKTRVRWPGGERVPLVVSVQLSWCVARFRTKNKDTSVSTLWTPSGEHEPSDSSADDVTEADFADPSSAYRGPEEPSAAEMEAEMQRARAELSSVPVADIIANHAVGLWQLAVLHLTPEPDPDGYVEPHLVEASLAIDAFAALVETLGDRLAPHDEAMKEALAQLRMAFVEVSNSE